MFVMKERGVVLQTEVDGLGNGDSPVPDSCKHGDKPPALIKDRDFLD
jgi:hypothetical protein